MYLYPTQSWYKHDGTQHSGRGWFLLLLQPEYDAHCDMSISAWLNAHPIRALVRKVALTQCGHWMMGTAHVLDHHLTVSGAYGADGLTMNVPPEVYEVGVRLDPEIEAAWANDTTGWNSAGESGKVIREWAIAHFEELIPKGARRANPQK